MKISEIIEIESKNAGEINLYLEGLFWKAYEQSAYLFSKNIASLVVKKKRMKKLNKEIVSLGFPKSSLERLFDQDRTVLINDKYIKFEGYEYDENDYKAWCEALPEYEAKNLS